VQTRLVGGFEATQARVRGLTASNTTGSGTTGRLDVPADQPGTSNTDPVTVQIPAPSTRFLRFVHPNGFFTIDYPDNWVPYRSGTAVTMAPPTGVLPAAAGRRQTLIYGVIINHYSAFAGPIARRNLSLQHNYAPFEDTTATRGTR
jgi:hypothetical protein